MLEEGDISSHCVEIYCLQLQHLHHTIHCILCMHVLYPQVFFYEKQTPLNPFNIKYYMCYFCEKIHNIYVLLMIEIINSTYSTVYQLLSEKSKGNELSFCHKLGFLNPYIFATWWCKSLRFQT